MRSREQRRLGRFRVHLSLLFLLTILPAAALEIYSSFEARRTDIEQAKQDALLRAKLAASDQEHLIEQARNVLAPLAKLTTISSTDSEFWNRNFKNLLLLQPRYVNFGLIETNGVLFASALPFRDEVDLSRRSFFTKAVKDRTFAVGEFEEGPLTNTTILGFGYPVQGGDGGLARVLFTTVDLHLIGELAAKSPLPPGGIFFILDRRGHFLSRGAGPQKVSVERFSHSPLFQKILAESEGTAELLDFDGVQRLYAFASLRDGKETGLSIAVGFPRDLAYASANRALWRNLSVLAGLAVLVVGAAQFYAHRNVLHPVETLTKSTQRLRAGDFSARTGLKGSGELYQLAQRFDEMADELQRNRGAAEEANREVAAINAKLEAKNLELQARTIELERNRLELQLIFDSAPALIFVKDRAHRHVRVNKALLDFHGLSREAIEGHTDKDMGLPEADRYYRDDDEVISSGQAKCGIVEPVETARGRRWLLTDKLPYRDANGQIAGVMGFAVDTTERRRLEEQLRQAQKMEAIGTLAGGIAHDFNNILAAINGYTELAMLEAADNPGLLAHLEVVARAGNRAVELVKQILVFSRQQEQERKPVQLRHVVREALKLLRATIPTTIEFKAEVAPDLPTVLADATQIHQVIMNLGTNAWHAMRDRPGRLEVELDEFVADLDFAEWHPRIRPGRYVLLTMSDTGHGMDQATLAHIFEPFFTTKAPGEGTGLGLSVVHGIMESHDGAISVYSHPGEGTKFHLYFPAFGGEEIEVATVQADIPRGKGERVLFVDDEAALAQLGKKMLERTGYTVTAATSPTEALDAIRGQPAAFDLVITDLMMPGMTGTQLATHILNIRPDIPVILTTGYTATLTPEKIRALGIRELLMKPLTLRALGSVVYRILAGGGHNLGQDRPMPS